MINQIHISSLKLSDEEIKTHAFAQSMHQDGISCAERIIADGKTHYFISYGKVDKECWYRLNCYGLTGAYGYLYSIQREWSANTTESSPTQSTPATSFYCGLSLDKMIKIPFDGIRGIPTLKNTETTTHYSRIALSCYSSPQITEE